MASSLTQKRTVVLSHRQISQKIKRMAYEIVEHNFNEKEFEIVGITGQGYTLAERLCREIQCITNKPVQIHSISLDKDKPLESEAIVSVPVNHFSGKYVLLVDDVLNSGRTLTYAVRVLIAASVKKMQVACLVDRRHRRFPVRADFVGITLSTTLQDHICVELNGTEDKAYLE